MLILDTRQFLVICRFNLSK